MNINLNPDGPHDAERTRQLGHTLTEIIRVLNHATRDLSGLPYPGTAYDLLGSLTSVVGGLSQLLGQVGDRLVELHATGRLQVRQGEHAGNPDRAVARADDSLTEAAQAAAELRQALARAHSALTWIGMRSDEDT